MTTQQTQAEQHKGMVISRFDDGMCAEDWVEADRLGMLEQLGVLPTLESAGA